MTFGAGTFADGTLAGIFAGGVAPAPPAVEPGEPPAVVTSTFAVEIAGQLVDPAINSLTVDLELGRQGSAKFSLHNVADMPVIGQPVRIFLNNDLIFGGAIDNVQMTIDPSESVLRIDCECTDNSYLLFRRKITQKWTNVQWSSIATDIVYNEGLHHAAPQDPLAVTAYMPLVEVTNGNAHDLLSETAAAIGCLFWVDAEKGVHLTQTVAELAPAPLDESNVINADIGFDRETYRNKQTVTVTGTPPNATTEALTVTYTRQNDDQIAARQAIEGGTGVYNDIETITHPSSNAIADLQQLAVSYAKIRLGLQGSIRQSAKVTTLQPGFIAGQSVEVSLPVLGLDGQWVIQKSSLTERDGLLAETVLEITRTSLRRQSHELWIEMVKRAKIIAVAPTIGQVVTAQVVTTIGSTPWVVPSGVVQVQISCHAPGGGGGGGAHRQSGSLNIYANGGSGGNGGLAISVIDVTPGESLTVVIGGAGNAGVTKTSTYPSTLTPGTAGGAGGTIQVKRGATILIQAFGGLGGGGGQAGYLTSSGAYQPTPIPGVQGGIGTGAGQINTSGGGALGGVKGTGSPFVQPTAGAAGKVVFEY